MNKLAIITGGTSGIGEEFAKQLAHQSYNIVIVGREKKRANHICRILEQQYSIKANFVYADLSTKEGLSRIEQYIQSLERIDILVNAAGFGINEYFLDSNIDTRENMITVHNIAIMRLCYITGKLMRQNNISGNIINVSSLASFLSVGDPLYSSTKAFIRIFSINLHYEWKKYGIYVQALCPGFVQTPFFENAGVKKIPKPQLLETSSVVSTSLRYLQSGKVLCIP